MYSSLNAFAEAIAATPVSLAFREHLWVVPTSQSIHILGVAVIFSLGLVISLKLMGIGFAERKTSELVLNATPWLWGAFAVLLATGLVQTIAEPGRQFSSPAFRLKFILLFVLVAAIYAFTRAVRLNPDGWDALHGRPMSQRLTGLILLMLLIAIIFCGRFIAYTTLN